MRDNIVPICLNDCLQETLARVGLREMEFTFASLSCEEISTLSLLPLVSYLQEQGFPISMSLK